MLIYTEVPTQVRNAFTLLWASLALSVLDIIAGLWQQFSPNDLDWFFVWMLVISFVFLAANAFIIYYASCQKKWARIVLLVLTTLDIVALVALYFIYSTESGDEDWWQNAPQIACTFINVIAIYWLFTGMGASWYSERAAVERPSFTPGTPHNQRE